MNNMELEKSTKIEDLNADIEQNWVLEIIQFTDPYCTWCWGSEPIMRKIKAIYGDQVKSSFVMGGLVENIDTFYYSHNNIGGPEKFEQGAAHWEEASGKHGQPVDIQVLYEMEGVFRSTYQASIAYKAAQIQDQSLADKFLRRMREAASAERKLIHKVEVQTELAGEIGLDTTKLVQSIESGEAEQNF